VHRILAGLIAVLLAGAIAAAIVKNNNSNPVVLGPTPGPSQTYTYPGLPPTAPPSETPIIPDTSAPTPSPTKLANTGEGSFGGAALIVIGLALAGGVAVVRTSARRA
jgi:uncharacterized membrane protein YraQ (UPF0718 family)